MRSRHTIGQVKRVVEFGRGQWACHSSIHARHVVRNPILLIHSPLVSGFKTRTLAASLFAAGSTPLATTLGWEGRGTALVPLGASTTSGPDWTAVLRRIAPLGRGGGTSSNLSVQSWRTRPARLTRHPLSIMDCRTIHLAEIKASFDLAT